MSTGQEVVSAVGWEGNRKYGDAYRPLHHRLWYSHLLVQRHVTDDRRRQMPATVTNMAHRLASNKINATRNIYCSTCFILLLPRLHIV